MGTGKGQSVSADELRHYFSEPSKAPEDLFALAKAVAATCQQPKAKESRTERVQVSYGFLGRKTYTKSVTRETETDYWILATKKGRRQMVEAGCGGPHRLEETDDVETIFCLAADGSFRKLQRTQETVLFDGSCNYRIDVGSWSAWEAQLLSDLDHFMIDFDFDGSITAVNPGYWRERTEVVGDMDFFLERGDYPSIRRVYSKGVGLYVALKGLVS